MDLLGDCGATNLSQKEKKWLRLGQLGRGKLKLSNTTDGNSPLLRAASQSRIAK
jgi:hypothetical protein